MFLQAENSNVGTSRRPSDSKSCPPNSKRQKVLFISLFSLIFTEVYNVVICLCFSLFYQIVKQNYGFLDADGVVTHSGNTSSKSFGGKVSTGA